MYDDFLPEERILTSADFRGYLVRYPHRDELNQMLAGTLEAPTKLAGGNYNPPNDPGGTLDLRGCVFHYCQWGEGANFTAARASDSRWQHVRLPRSILRRVDFTGAHWFHVFLNDSDLSGAILTRAQISEGRSHRTTMRGLKAIGSTWRDWEFGAATSPENPANLTHLEDADFTNATFDHCTFHNCVLSRVSFRNCNFTRCQFDPFPLSHAIDFTGAKNIQSPRLFPPRKDCLNGVWPTQLMY